MTAQQLALRPEGDTPEAGAAIDGKPSMRHGRRLSQFSMPPPGLVKYTSTIELWDTTFDALNEQVALAIGRTPLALRFSGQSVNDAAAKCSGCTLSVIGATMGWPTRDIPLTLDFGGSQASDPIITGFDDSVFHFDEVGDYNMLWEASGLRIDATFEGTGEAAESAHSTPAEKSFARAIRVVTPNGKWLRCDMASCSMASIHANASSLQGKFVEAGGCRSL
ncbi:hypothetical protein N2152v2_005530 [Parachlorella kessleri]